MELKQVYSAADVPNHLKRAAKIALSVGAAVFTATDDESLLVKFQDADRYYFDPENVTLHMLEALNAARMLGFIAYRDSPACKGDDGNITTRYTGYRVPLIVRIVHSIQDVRVQIGASRFYASTINNTGVAMRHALCDAFCDYYDQAIQPVTEA